MHRPTKKKEYIYSIEMNSFFFVGLNTHTALEFEFTIKCYCFQIISPVRCSRRPRKMLYTCWRMKMSQLMLTSSASWMRYSYRFFWTSSECHRMTPPAHGGAEDSVRLLLTKKPRPLLQLPAVPAPRYLV